MAIDKECEAKILRYHFVEHWGVNTIASQLGIHHSTVDRVLSQAGLPKIERAISPSIIDPYVPFMIKTLAQYPTLTATRLYDMALERGYTGGVSHFRARVAQLRPRPVAVARGNEGRVERSIRYIRSGFFAGRQWRDIDDLNAQADVWCRGKSANRPCPEDTSMTVREAFAQEQPKLLALPENPFPTDERIEVSVGKTPYVRFDLNDYSILHTHVRQLLTVSASLTRVWVLDGVDVVAEHARSYSKGEQIEDPSHIQALTDYKHRAREHSGQDRLAHAAPGSVALLELAVQRGHRPTTVTSLLTAMLDDYGASELACAIDEALQQQAPHPNAVRQVLERRREQRDQPPPLAITLPDNPKAKNAVVRPASLARYDQLNPGRTTDEEETPQTPEIAPTTPGDSDD